jgi:hypothetical protein
MYIHLFKAFKVVTKVFFPIHVDMRMISFFPIYVDMRMISFIDIMIYSFMRFWSFFFTFILLFHFKGCYPRAFTL